MLLRLRLATVPHLTAFLLVLGVLLGGSIDAAACEPDPEIAAITAIVVDADASADPGSGDQMPANERHGDCVHGHCHHGAQQIPASAVPVDLPMESVGHAMVRVSDLASLPPGSLKRPPRA